MNRLEAAQDAYFEAFGRMPPQPWGIDDNRVAQVLEDAVGAGVAVPDAFDWWGDLPSNAVA